MSMLTFYANRAGRNLGAEQRRVLGRAKGELRKRLATLRVRRPRDVLGRLEVGPGDEADLRRDYLGHGDAPFRRGLPRP